MTAQTDRIPGLFGKSGDDSAEEPAVAQTKSTTGGDLDQKPVVVWEAANNMEAQIVKGRLESEGIPAIIRGEAAGIIYGLTSGSLAATDILVPAAIAEKAIEILNTEVEWVFDDEMTDSEDPTDDFSSIG